ncbi:MarR family winged helix-turn-helix transcriptional regulator [Neisseria sp. Ec49-e6-T10]|uniref:MarR family winged helix-turn-helix transcriptional regulator n=1 Tax=Neisseria sp. Ec49-e6-T10 TaxID=3140744 RepID=UPI003EB727AE
MSQEKFNIPIIGEGKRGQDGHIAYLFRQAYSSYRIQMEQALSSVGVTFPQFVILTMLKAYPDISGADLAHLSLLTPQTITVILKNLEKEQFIERVPDPNHGRKKQTRITSLGYEKLQTCEGVVSELENKLIQTMPKGTEQFIKEWLVNVAKGS